MRKFNVGDKVKTKVRTIGGIPAGTSGVVESIHEDVITVSLLTKGGETHGLYMNHELSLSRKQATKDRQ